MQQYEQMKPVDSAKHREVSLLFKHIAEDNLL